MMNKLKYISIFALLATNLLFAQSKLVALMHTTENFISALDGIKSELGEDDYEVIIIDVDKYKKPKEAFEKVKELAPKGLILMDSKAISFVKEFQNLDSNYNKIPKFVLMTLQIESAVKGLNSVAGIRFEVPGYTIFTNLRILSEKDFSKVGVFYRKDFENDILESKRLLSNEKIELFAICLDCDETEMDDKESTKKMISGFKDLTKKNDIDVFGLLGI